MNTDKDKFTPVMTVEITRYGFELHNVKGELIEEAEPANKGKLHRLLSSLGYKPTIYAEQWLKRGATIATHSNEKGVPYYSTTDENGKPVYSFSPKFDDIWTEDTANA